VTRSRKIVAVFLAAFLVLGLAACSNTSAADRADQNLSKAAENFEVQRRIVGINGITDNVLFMVEGFCSIERYSGQLDVICKVSKNSVERTSLGLSDNVTFVITQLAPEKVDFYRPRVILRPKALLPDFDLATGEPGK
jgi:hypothetical protein